MSEEHSWQRITDVVRKISNDTRIPVPEALEHVSGDAWERNRQQRAALQQFTNQVEGMPLFTDDVPVDEIADALDVYWLEIHFNDLPESR